MLNILSVNWSVNPEIFRIGGIAIRWYGLLFVAGFFLGYYIFQKFCKREGISEKMIDPLLYTLLIGTIVGARLGHCLFYQPDYYLGSWEGFWEIFQPWKGGLASHGGAIALVLAMIWFSRKYGPRYDFDFFWIMDRLCLTVAFAGCFIRLGNLFNSEIYGGVTSLPWGFVFLRNGETLPKHPTQLYEAFAYLILGLSMLAIYNKDLQKLYKGTLTGIFLTGCFGARFLIEFIKNPQVEFEQDMVLNMGQLLSIPFIVLGITAIAISFIKKKPAASDRFYTISKAAKR
ncbi:MAG: prolipoprotein diacylglyceryl transferase [Bacteroidales bacterium]|nr:prolipoprotein diacylglyceryl transferase [Candidatus Cryptobacteroides fimicaballi]